MTYLINLLFVDFSPAAGIRLMMTDVLLGMMASSSVYSDSKNTNKTISFSHIISSNQVNMKIPRYDTVIITLQYWYY